MFMGRRRSSVFSCSSGVNSPEIAMRISGNIGDDFFDRFSGLQTKSHEYTIRADKEASKDKVLPGSTTSAAVTVPGARRQSRVGSATSSSEELEELYVEVLYTLKHKIGQQTAADHHQHGSQQKAATAAAAVKTTFNDELLQFAQAAFGIDNARHVRLLSKANQEKPPKVVLHITVVEARDLEAKDANGFSDPYCMLGLIGHKSRKHVDLTSTPSQDNAMTDEGKDWRARKVSLYGKNRSKSRKDCTNNDVILEQLPAKFIRATTVKKATLNPIWNESFHMIVDNVNEDVLHLDIFDQDEEYEVMDAVKNLKNVQGIKGLNRYFKQIAQSARKSAADNVDDFLGCTDIKITDVPSIGIDKVFNLCSRSNNKVRVQGTIRLRLGLATREDKDQGNNLSDFIQHRDLYLIFMKSEIKKYKSSLEWTGEMSSEAETILHQHAIQGDLTDLQEAACMWNALIDTHVTTYRLDSLVLFQALKHLDSLWVANGLSPEAEEVTAEAVGAFKDFALASLDRQSYYFPMKVPSATRQLESLLKCLRLLYECKLFQRFFPLEGTFHDAIYDSVKTSALEYYHSTRQRFMNTAKSASEALSMDEFSSLIAAVCYDIRSQFRVSDKIFSTFKIKYYAITMAELDRMIAEDLDMFPVLQHTSDCGKIMEDRDPYAALRDDFFTAPGTSLGKEEPNGEIFVLFFALNDFVHLCRHLTPEERSRLVLKNFHDRFIFFVLQWFSYAKVAAKRKMKAWVEKDKVSRTESAVRYSMSVVEATNCISAFDKFVVDLKWPDEEQRCILMCKLINDVAEIEAYFSEITYRAFKDSGWTEHELLEVNDDLCIAVNNMEIMRTHIAELPNLLGYFELTKQFRESPDPALAKFGQECDAILTQSLANGEKMLTERIVKALEKLTKKMSVEIAGHLSLLIRDPTHSVDALTTPILELMDVALSSLYNAMLKANFLRFLEILWHSLLDQILATTLTNRSKEPMNFINIYQSLSLFIEYFRAGEKGLPKEIIEGERYYSVKRKIFYYQLSTPELIDTFLVEAVTVQTEAKKPHMELIHAREVIPMDTNGLSDPFVVMRLLPVRLFGTTHTAKTAVVKKSLDPEFNETFEFQVPVESCMKDCSVIHFALMDHDLMFQDELAGEAFLQLSRMPGLRGEQTKNFTGLREVTLAMLHPSMMNKGILADIIDVLKCREQKDGLDFLATLFVE
ncbi:BAI1-associated protein 3 [Hypsibius exemplaris]|uniref:BAI1-associated protein 3 n=1 Tax=Hypsibius exemplaris TaxID=2072580 RepID=A0A1W0XAF1_HYPEX|nr:BAI1-associated protein 3 [Hypsibius exemplaris]